jgi:HSP20 family protein
MTIKDLIPWNKGRSVPVHGSDDVHPLLAMHREMNRMFDNLFRGFDLAPLSMDRRFGAVGWPNIDIDDNGKEIRITAELPGLEEKDVELQIAKGMLSISGEKKSETEDKERRFSERFFGRFERRIPLEDADEEKAEASFRDGLLTVTVPKSRTAMESVRRIPINSKG